MKKIVFNVIICIMLLGAIFVVSKASQPPSSLPTTTPAIIWTIELNNINMLTRTADVTATRSDPNGINKIYQYLAVYLGTDKSVFNMVATIREDVLKDEMSAFVERIIIMIKTELDAWEATR